ncbi:Hypothetical_protein [Hexamita inflata]|uniref:Hypothetical_protein n=1 Tax=Hexamita inflata TaxID=28002 RepID=A0AA86N8B5_9EUKA|nr:Hypothetical protein HINF_LOCUS2226 [Hexamita inflata]
MSNTVTSRIKSPQYPICIQVTPVARSRSRDINICYSERNISPQIQQPKQKVQLDQQKLSELNSLEDFNRIQSSQTDYYQNYDYHKQKLLNISDLIKSKTSSGSQQQNVGDCNQRKIISITAKNPDWLEEQIKEQILRQELEIQATELKQLELQKKMSVTQLHLSQSKHKRVANTDFDETEVKRSKKLQDKIDRVKSHLMKAKSSELVDKETLQKEIEQLKQLLEEKTKMFDKSKSIKSPIIQMINFDQQFDKEAQCELTEDSVDQMELFRSSVL